MKYFFRNIILAFAICVNTNCEAYTYNFSGTFTNTSIGLPGTVTLSFDMTSDDSIIGEINFTDLTGGIVPLCAAGQVTGVVTSTDSIFLSFTSHDTDFGCGFDWGAYIIINAFAIVKCDSIVGEYVYQNQQQGYFNLTKISGPDCTVGIPVFSRETFSVQTICTTCKFFGNVDEQKLQFFDMLGRARNYRLTKENDGGYFYFEGLESGIYFIRNTETGQTSKIIIQ